jgi:hypothetical protein
MTVEETCKYHIVKPFAEKQNYWNSPKYLCFRDEEKEYCTHPDALRLPGTPEGVNCGGDASNCDLPKAKR